VNLEYDGRGYYTVARDESKIERRRGVGKVGRQVENGE